MLGGGREKLTYKIDPAVGLVMEKKLGDPVQAGEALCTVHYNSDARLRESLDLLARSFAMGPQPPPMPALISKTFGTEEYSKERERERQR